MTLQRASPSKSQCQVSLIPAPLGIHLSFITPPSPRSLHRQGTLQQLSLVLTHLNTPQSSDRIEMAKGSKITKVSSATKPAKPVRKKFAVPPVKLACLECRASRTRCDGKPECSNCINRGKSCVYTQSKRGGSRIRRRRVSVGDQASGEHSPKINNNELNACALSVMPELEEGIFTHEPNPPPSIRKYSEEKSEFNIPDYQGTFAAPLSLVSPGGGLKQLDFSLDDTDFIFDSIFAAQPEGMDSGYETSEHAGTSSESGKEVPIRVYSSDEDILSAYYTYIHPYFPILPPPEPGQVTDNPDFGIRRAPDAIFSSKSVPDFEPSSPISLAISATLALIPHPEDKDPSGTESLHLRREQAQAFAQSAFESIEIESELIDSVIQPGEALSSEPLPPHRKPFHLRNPIENESIIALIMLSTYEYAQRGNIAKMRNRAGQAVNAAINLGLHIKGDEEGYYSEANRRVWWMAYITVCQGSILSNSTPPILLYDPRFTTSGPTYAGDPGAWPVFLQSQQAITSATQFVIDLDATLKQGSNTTAIWDRMLELEAIIEPLIVAADSWTLSSTPPLSLDSAEMVVGQALRGIARIKLNSARIKLHRYCAFSDVPVFSKKHCDLAAAAAPNSNSTTNPSSTSTAPNCACSNTFHNLPSYSDMTSSNPQSFPSTTSSPNLTQNLNINMNLNPNLGNPNGMGLGMGVGMGMGVGLNCNVLPYTSHYSAKICLKSAFSIARSFSSLPYPQPIRRIDLQSQLQNHNQAQNQVQTQNLNMQSQDPYSYFPTMQTPNSYTRHSLSPPSNPNPMNNSRSNSNSSSGLGLNPSSASISGGPGPGPAGGRAPRMIPVFACCAMQSSYALIMLSYKTKAMGFAGPLHNTNPTPNTNASPNHSHNGVSGNGGDAGKENQAQKLLGQLSEGLQMILAALRNYSIAYEALGGMRDQIDVSAQSVGAAASVVSDVRW
ncbi:C6 zinc finger domain-containing protein [Cadophora sp. MPI-SDFR-AT-0126]|nr:C6 zinc finger domain-containing protein [Leotiomycetes sp. MPI-SDFR-AT-0126]